MSDITNQNNVYISKERAVTFAACLQKYRSWDQASRTLASRLVVTVKKNSRSEKPNVFLSREDIERLTHAIDLYKYHFETEFEAENIICDLNRIYPPQEKEIAVTISSRERCILSTALEDYVERQLEGDGPGYGHTPEEIKALSDRIYKTWTKK